MQLLCLHLLFLLFKLLLRKFDSLLFRLLGVTLYFLHFGFTFLKSFIAFLLGVSVLCLDFCKLFKLLLRQVSYDVLELVLVLLLKFFLFLFEFGPNGLNPHLNHLFNLVEVLLILVNLIDEEGSRRRF